MSVLFVPVLAASLMGSLHCAAMCGPFVAAAGGFGSGGAPSVGPRALYHLGRLGGYLVLGAAAGLVGSGLDLAGSAAGIGRVSALVAGAVLVVSGASALFARRGLVPLRRSAPHRLGRWLGALLSKIQDVPPLRRALVLGLSTAFVPCGWLYAFVATAAGTGRVPTALGVMVAFWAGSVPALAATELGWRRLVARLGARARVATAALVIASGVAMLGLRLGAPGTPGPAARAEAAGPAAAPCPLHAQ